MDKRLVNNKVFYADFIKEIKKEIKGVGAELLSFLNDRDTAISGMVEKIKIINTNYSLNNRIGYSEEYLTNFLLEDASVTLKGVSKTRIVSASFDKYVTVKIKEIAKLNYDIKVKQNELKELKSCVIPYTKYRDISNLYNEWSMRYALDGGSIKFATDMGTISILNLKKDFNGNGSLKVDNKKSQAYKQVLISKGKRPYNKQEHEEAKAKGEEYDGVEWLIYHYEDSYPYIHWYKGKTKDITGMYKFIPVRGNNVFKTIDDAVSYLKESNNPDDLFDKGMGFVQNLSVLKQAIPGYLNKFPKGFNN